MAKPKSGKGSAGKKMKKSKVSKPSKISKTSKSITKDSKKLEPKKEAGIEDLFSQLAKPSEEHEKIKEAKVKEQVKRKRQQREKVKTVAEGATGFIPAASVLGQEAGTVSYEDLGPEVAKDQISVKPIPKINSGIPGLDDMTDGGFEEKSIILINGDPGSGKTILGLQFLYAGAMRGEAGLYVSFGEPREWLYPRMMSFGMNFQELENKKLFFVIEYQPHEIAKLMQEEGGTIYDIVMAYNVKRIVVDPITPYLVQYENLYDARLALVRLMNVVRKWNATTLLLNEVSTKIEPHPTSTLTEFLTDGVLNLIHKPTEEGIQLRGVEIWKLCGIAHMEVARPFAFTKRGIVVYPTERLFAKTK
jgi:circadian clock protein KaiC